MTRYSHYSGFKKLRTIFLLLLLICAVGVAVAVRFLPEAERKAAGDDQIRLLHDYYKDNSYLFENSGWSLDQISFAYGVARVVFVFPNKKPGLARIAPIYSSLKKFCPVPEEGEFWSKSGASSIILYLRRENKQGATMMARCFPSDNQDMLANLSSSVDHDAVTLELLPPKSNTATDEAIKQSLAMGHPSFNEVLNAIDQNDSAKLQRILERRPELTQMYDRLGQTLLHHANSASIVVVLIAFGANPNVIDDRDFTLVDHLACNLRDKATLMKLFQMGASAKGSHVGCVRKVDIAELLLENGATIDKDSLWDAVNNLQDELADYLYARGARFVESNQQDPILHESVSHVFSNVEQNKLREFKTLELILRYIEDVNRKNRRGQTALDIALAAPSYSYRGRVINLLVEHGAKSAAELEVQRKSQDRNAL